MIEFPVSGVETYWWLPPVVAFLISAVTASGGLSGAFLLLPFQVSVLGFAGPSVTSTNLVFNALGPPTGVYRYWREKRMIWPLAGTTVVGLLPGMACGALIRIYWLPDPAHFKPFAGLVLAAVGLQVVRDVVRESSDKSDSRKARARQPVTDITASVKRLRFKYGGRDYSAPVAGIAVLAFVVGAIGGAYGIGGGVVIAPFLVSVIGLPVYTIAGATLFSTFVGSVVGILAYSLFDLLEANQAVTASPDWALGVLLGAGGVVGMYVGARIQKHLPSRLIKGVLAASLLGIAARYISGVF